jgi:hypothetical protein
MYLGQLGDLLGNAEVTMYKHMKSSGLKSTTVEKNGIKYTLRIGPSPDTNQVMAVFIDELPVLRSNIHHVLSALEALEDTID